MTGSGMCVRHTGINVTHCLPIDVRCWYVQNDAFPSMFSACLVVLSDEEPTQSKQIKSEAQVDRQPWQRKREGKTKRKRQADPEAAQGQSRGKTKTGRAVGATEMQHVVVELTNLKRDLKQWRSSTERSMPS